MVKYSLVIKLLYWARDLMSKKMYVAIRTYLAGDVLDVGGALFVKRMIEMEVPFKKWITLETSEQKYINFSDPRVVFEVGDGCHLNFPDNSFDTLLNIQVLEHTFEPFQMFKECIRVLKPQSYAIFLIPQTAVMHLAPYHYQNFLRFWILEAAQRCSCEIVELTPLGGWWGSIASRLVYFFLALFRASGSSVSEIKRSPLFYVLMPFMALYSLVNIPITLIFSLADLHEEPMNHLVVIRKK